MHRIKARLFNLRDSSRKPSLHLICALRARPNPIKPIRKKFIKAKIHGFTHQLVEKEKYKEQQTNANHWGVLAIVDQIFFVVQQPLLCLMHSKQPMIMIE